MTQFNTLEFGSMTEIRKLAIDSYNRAFDLVIEGDQHQLLEGLELAATSLHLWKQVGTQENEAIGLWLYSRALQKAGAKELATQAAERSLELAEKDWMIASALEALTRATGDEMIKNRAIAAIEAIQDPDDRDIIASQFADLR